MVVLEITTLSQSQRDRILCMLAKPRLEAGAEQIEEMCRAEICPIGPPMNRNHFCITGCMNKIVSPLFSDATMLVSDPQTEQSSPKG